MMSAAVSSRVWILDCLLLELVTTRKSTAGVNFFESKYDHNALHNLNFTL